MTRLSRRLQRVTANVMSGGVVADIGCDHGLVSIALVEDGRVASAIAMDVAKGPLSRARENVLRHGLSDKVALRLSDGAEKLLPGEADTLLMSGMGGALMCRILWEGREVVASAKELVLSPQSEVFLVRQCVHEVGFRIAAEEMVREQGKYYVILRAVPGAEVYPEEMDYIYGKKLMDRRDEVLLAFLAKEKARVGKVLRHLEAQGPSREGEAGKRKLRQEKARIQKAMGRMEAGDGKSGYGDDRDGHQGV